jgi:UDP-perosamine 4-acetyltransferase
VVVLDILLANGADVVGLTDEHTPVGSRVLGIPVLGTDAALTDLRARGVREAIVALGDNDRRESVARKVIEAGLRLTNAIHPSAVIGRDVELGIGIAIMANAVVNPRVMLADGVIVNTGASVDHDCVIGAYAHIAPGVRLGGGVRCGTRVFVGIGASLLPRVVIGDAAIVAAGAVVISDVVAAARVAGVPARPMT